ncbi:MAG TPA: magnesium transporter [Verrucomicrobiae bacterium]
MNPLSPRQVSGELVQKFVQLFPEEAAKEVERLNVDEALDIVVQLEASSAAGLLDALLPEFSSRVLDALPLDTVTKLVLRMDPVRAAMAMLRLSAEKQQQILQSLPPMVTEEMRELMVYPADSAGGLMDPRVMSFRKTTLAGEALDAIRASRQAKIYDVYLVDDQGILNGCTALQDIALADQKTPLGELARKVPGSVPAVEPAAEVVRLFEEKKLSSVPIVDFEGKLLGVVRYDVLLSAAQEEAVEDLQSMVGVSPDERALSSPFFAVKKRLPWLQINLATAFLAAAVVGLFEETIAQVTALAVLLPVVAGQSGNTGAQALAVAIRGLTLKEIRISQWLLLVRKESISGFINGIAVGIVTGLGVWVWSKSFGLVMVITCAMVMSMTIASISGALVPLILKACKQDPAQSSSIILTTVTDVMGFFSFLGLAKLFMHLLPKDPPPKPEAMLDIVNWFIG